MLENNSNVETCEYVQEDSDSNEWVCSKCDNIFILNSDNPYENEMFYCPKCGRLIAEIHEDIYDWDSDGGEKHIMRVVTREDFDK